ncbi:hypothetical protein S7711_08085 [Stachybotrys chartarum IBT 7711]|uniref:Cx9C motif-containing protein 4, mitochondrial n=1 Tax=Stachybotrys chartarum (strain CBS 109288 / IBT 7711) TaxID=1280523 RepID=A0A084B238_STACB|nr:hypothetical protein S7711_08085 [Stachybotrys chartarum IBT 7711]KFA79638.1 hypothetical protein S40288_04102 [Stachybotrys chartarum IBT 40288]
MQATAKDADIEAQPPCHPRACAIQDCLSRNNYNEAKCQNAVKALYACCEAFYDKYGDDASTPSCPKPKLLRLKLQQQKDGI